MASTLSAAKACAAESSDPDMPSADAQFLNPPVEVAQDTVAVLNVTELPTEVLVATVRTDHPVGNPEPIPSNVSEYEVPLRTSAPWHDTAPTNATHSPNALDFIRRSFTGFASA